ECIYTKHLCLDGRQIHLEIYVTFFLHVNLNFFQPQRGKLSLTDELHWADGFIIVYDISDRASFAFAKALLYRIRESHIGACKKVIESSVFLVGNKQDLCHMREVGWDEGQKLAMDNKCQFCELSAAEHYQEVVAMFTKVLRNITSNGKVKEKRRPSGSKSMAKLINNVFGKRRKSV
ncbi:Ras-related and estrogen-regulated growth inhibitor-like, partial [Antrostomus carolinensis]